MSDELEVNASNERQPAGGPGKLTPQHNPKPFTSDYQPGAAKSKATRAKQKTIRDAFKLLLKMKYQMPEKSKLRKELVKAFGEAAVKKMTTADLMAVQQMQKAIKKGDTFAFTAVLNQAMGMPKQEIEDVSDRPAPPVILNMPPGVSLNLPSNTEGDA